MLVKKEDLKNKKSKTTRD